MNLRPYQQKAVDAVFNEWKEKRSTLIVLPTGCGKTICFADIIARAQPKRALVIAHRSELITQAQDKISRYAGLVCDVEMANQYARSGHEWHKCPVVLSTVQSQCAGFQGEGRMSKFHPGEFGLLIFDECHHATSETYQRLIRYYGQNAELKVLGVTATPDRADEEALGQIFESVAFDYEILDAIHEGWLVPIEQQMVTIEGLDFSDVRTTAGDLNGADLAEIMEAEEMLQGVAASTLDIVADKRTLVFAASVKQAEMLADIFNRHRPNSAGWVCGKTPKDDREDLLRRFSDGQTQIVVNVGVLTEGYDNPAVEVIIQARPTKSRALYSQMIGRATRPLAGLVDGLDSDHARKSAIAGSSKPSMLVIDFVGNSGRHKLITTADILGGNVSDEAIERAIERAKKEGRPVRMSDALDEEAEKLQQEIEEKKRLETARRARLTAIAKYAKTSVNPFDVFQLSPVKDRGWDAGKELSQKQKDLLLKQGIDPDLMTYPQSKKLIAELFRRWNDKLCTFKQAKLLQKHGFDTREMTMQEASKQIDILARNGWRRPQPQLPF